MSRSTCPKLASLWVGGNLSGIERLSAQSFLDQGHDLIIYSYDKTLGNVPDGVEIRDAREVFDTTRILRYDGTGSPAIHANLFRYQLLAKTDHIWVDLDIVALRPFVFSTEHVYGWENGTQINNAVLRLPSGSPALRKLLKFTPETVGRPLAAGWKRRLRWIVNMRGRSAPIENWPWGATGPTAVTYHLRRSGESDQAQPVNAFYPVAWNDTLKLLETSDLTPDNFPDSYGIHLWGKFIRRNLDRMGGKPKPDSLLDRLLLRHSVPI